MGSALCWNTFFSDITTHVAEGKQQARLFADDLNVDTKCKVHVSDDLLLEELAEAQQRAHSWGVRNRVCFDSSKESFHVVHPRAETKTEFKMLGSLLDSGLTMRPLIDQLLTKCRPKAKAIQRLVHVFSVPDLICQFKAHVWSHLEYSNGAIIMANVTDRRRLDTFQRGFLYNLNLSDTEAFVTFNFAPPSLRRAIGLLGLLHKRTLGLCHPALCQALPFVQDAEHRYHTKTLVSNLELVHAFWPLYNKSLWMYVLIYNRLPQDMVNSESVSCFQSKLTQIAKYRAQIGDIHWREAFQSCEDVIRFFH